MTAWRLMTLALSSPDKFHEGDQYAGRGEKTDEGVLG
jgi:hypothetical protein